MTLFLNKIDKKEWIAQLKKIGTDQKWLLSIYMKKDNEFYSISYQKLSNEIISIGACYFLKMDSGTDCSFFIFPEYRRKGFAKKFITEVISNYDNIQFTVSQYNKPSVSLFESIPLLKQSNVNERLKTMIYKKIRMENFII